MIEIKLTFWGWAGTASLILISSLCASFAAKRMRATMEAMKGATQAMIEERKATQQSAMALAEAAREKRKLLEAERECKTGA